MTSAPSAILLSIILFAACTASDPAPPATAAAYNPFPDCSYEHKDALPGATLGIDVPMRDCVHLSTNVIFPREPRDRYPVVLVRTPYDKGKTEEYPLIDISTLFRHLGFVSVIQDTRGRFESEGVHVVLVDEPADTADTLKWLELQPWFDGRMGIWGASYLALSAISGAIQRPDLVKAIVVSIMGSDWYKLGSHHGIARADGLRFAAGTATSNTLGASLDSKGAFADEIQRFPLSEADQRAGLGTLPFTEVFINHTKRDGFWKEMVDPADFHQLDMPIFMLTGWFDFQWRNQVEDYNAIYARRKGKDHFLHIGPWPHLLGFDDSHDYDFSDPRTGLEGMIDSARFLAWYVLGEGDFADEPPVTWYDAGTGAWHDTNALWPASTEELVFYPASSTDSSCPHRLLPTAASAETLTYVYDPEQPFEMPGVLTLQEGEMVEAAEWCGRSDGQIFETAPFSEPIELAGDIAMDLEISSDVADTPFVARLNLVERDGTIYNLREGVMLLSHREGDSAPLTYTPGERVTLTVPIPSLRWTLQPGQKLRIGIASSAWPLIVPHPNVAGEWWLATEPKIATQTVHLGTGNTTRLRLTVNAP